MRDSYQEMLGFFRVSHENFVHWGIEEISNLLPDVNAVQKEWDLLLQRIQNSGTVYIRGYGRDKITGEMDKIRELYKQAGFSGVVNLDKTNNSQPQKLMKRMSVYRVGNKDSKCFIGIQNYKLSHMWGFTKNIYLFASPWNILYTPVIIDPLTGHETGNNPLKILFKQEMAKLLFTNYKAFIDAYNMIIKTSPMVQQLIEICNKYPDDRFYQNMKKNWCELTPDNIFQC